VRPWAVPALLLALSACAKPAPPPPEPVALDCAQSFEAQKAAITSQPALNPAPKDPAEPYRFYSTADGRASWLITEPGAPGHPAILMQRARGADVVTTGCPYGDRAGYEQLHAYLDSLKTWRRK
jgi:hypothetical protein